MRKTTSKTPKTPKIFVLDTNVILHDHMAIRKFQSPCVYAIRRQAPVRTG